MMFTGLFGSIFSRETFFAIATLVFSGWLYLRYKWNYFQRKQIPFIPPSIRKAGNLKDIFNMEKIFQFDLECKKKYGKIYGYYSWTNPSLAIHDPDILAKIFVKEFPSFPVRRRNFTTVSGKEMNEAITNVEGKQWKRMRSTISPSFSTSKLKMVYPILNDCCNRMIDNLNKITEGDKIAIIEPMNMFGRLSMDMVLSSSFGADTNTRYDTAEESEIVTIANRAFSKSFFTKKVMLLLVLPFLEPVFAFFKINVFDAVFSKYFKNLTLKMMQQKRDNPKDRRVDLLQLLMDAHVTDVKEIEKTGKGLTETEIIGNSMLSIIAGYENTKLAVVFMCYSLAMYPEEQKRLFEEIESIVEKPGDLTYEELHKMKFLDQCMNESLRLYMPILKNGRMCDRTIEINGLEIEKGVKIDVPSYAMSHDPEYWEDPFEYKPDRMDDMSQINPMLFQPFGAGLRNCIGKRFAMLEVKCVIANLISQFEILPSDDTPKPPLEVAFRSGVKPKKTDFKLKVKRRQKIN